jgi:hypothetical protein
MYCVLNTITTLVITVGSKEDCELFIKQNPSYEKFCKVMKVVNVEGEVIPYDEHFSSGYRLANKRDLSC